MPKWISFLIVCLASLFFITVKAYSQKQDVEFHLKYHLLNGKKILKVKRDFYDPYLWALAQNNEVYRVNSLTQQIDDYTASFAAYSNLQFVDIAGRCLDSVYIATNSTNIIRFENNQLHLIQASDGIPGTVNSVGMQNGTVNGFIIGSSPVLIIGADGGFRNYDTNTTKVTPLNYPGKSKVYEATYRDEMFEDSSTEKIDIVTTDTIQYQPITMVTNSVNQVVEYLYEGGKSFGYNINTADNIYGAMYGHQDVFLNLFWGNSRGMFQNYGDYSYFSIYYPWGHYLDGINVNKITNIYGLTSFGSGQANFPPGYIKQNLLVGTDKGFYFSNSIYTGANDPLRSFNLFHDDEIGNVPINDICVNGAKIKPPICEDGIWLAANDGLYFIVPDYSNSIKNKQLKAISFLGLEGKAETQLCTGTVTAEVDTIVYTGDIIKWYKDGSEIHGENATSLVITAAGNYNAAFYDPCSNQSIESNHLQVDATAEPVFTFNDPDELKSCSGNTVVLNVQGNASYQYRWYKNGVLTGITTDSFSASQSGKYNVEVSSCAGSWVSSKIVQVDFIQLPTPVITPDKPAYCTGDQATLALNIIPDDSYTITWSRDGVTLSGYQDKMSITTNIAGNYIVAINSKLIGSCTQLSSPLNIYFEPPPNVSIQQIINTTLCDGQTINIKVTHDNGTVKWSTGESTDQISVVTSGTYKARVTSAAGCTTDVSTNIQFFQNPVLTISDTSLCERLKETVTLEAPTGYEKYVWNGVEGNNTFMVNKPQAVSLNITDVNGCQTSQTIIVSSKCPNISPSNITIPNTFTPNGDGINDTWVISGIDNDPTISVRVFNRYGTEVYKSIGYRTPWNGQYGGKKLQSGVYYYIITTNNNKQTYSGSLTIIY